MSEEVELASAAAQMFLQGEREGAGWAWCRAGALALERGDLAVAGERTTAAIRAIIGLDRPHLRASLELLLSELAAEVGQPREAAALWLAAERGFREAGDEGGFLACWVAAAEHALSGGDPDRGEHLARWVLPRLDEVQSEERVWLRLRLAAALAAVTPDEAVALCRHAGAIAAGDSGQRLAAAALATRLLLERGDVEGGAAEALSALETSSGPAMLRSGLFRMAAYALRKLGHEDAALACEQRTDEETPAAPPVEEWPTARVVMGMIPPGPRGVPGRRTITQYLRPRRK